MVGRSITHGNGLSTRYGHLSEINVKVSDDHQDRQLIVAVGSTVPFGPDPHLHYDPYRWRGGDSAKFCCAGVRLTQARAYSVFALKSTLGL